MATNEERGPAREVPDSAHEVGHHAGTASQPSSAVRPVVAHHAGGTLREGPHALVVGGTAPFTWGGLAGVGGASVAVTTITGSLSAAFQWAYPTWLPFVLSLSLVVLADLSVKHPSREHGRRGLVRPVLWLLNGCLVFTTAVGGSRLIVPPEAGGGGPGVSLVPSGLPSVALPREVELPAPHDSAGAPAAEGGGSVSSRSGGAKQEKPRAGTVAGDAAARNLKLARGGGGSGSVSRPPPKPAAKGESEPRAKGFMRLREISLF